MKNLITITLTIVSSMTCQIILAQGGAPPPPGVPIDGGLSILFGAAIAYAAGKTLNKKRNE